MIYLNLAFDIIKFILKLLQTKFTNFGSPLRISFEKQKSKKTVNASTNGYPTNVDTVYNERLQDSVPVYTKTATSTQDFAAGYWGILFPHGWRPSFCPRYKTLQDYTHLGPYTNEADMYLAIKRRGQEDEKNNKFGAVFTDSTN